MRAPPAPGIRPRENTYGSLKRLRWIERYLRSGDRILEVGCGTGVMITLPLLEASNDVRGLDLDEASIEYGRRAAAEVGLDPERITFRDLREAPGPWDVVIMSEVLEHQSDDGVRELIGLVRDRLAPGGRLLVTVPNGRGWFELESWLWFRVGIGRVLQALRVDLAAHLIKRAIFGSYEDTRYLSTLEGSPHLQQFSLDSIASALEQQGLHVLERDGSVLVSGPFSNMLFTGVPFLMRLNTRLGTRFPHTAASFFVATEKPEVAS